MLLCRALLDLLNAPPSTPACGYDEMPLHVELRWATKGGLAFDATSLVRRTDLAALEMAAPPVASSFAQPSLPELGAQALDQCIHVLTDEVRTRNVEAADLQGAEGVP